MCLAQGQQRSDAGEARTRGPSVSSQALYHWATALPMIWYLMIMAYCELLLPNSLNLHEILGWLIDVNLVIVYLPTNFFIKRIVKITAFLCSTTKYSNILGSSKNIDFCELVYHKHLYVRWISVEFEQF